MNPCNVQIQILVGQVTEMSQNDVANVQFTLILSQNCQLSNLNLYFVITREIP